VNLSRIRSISDGEREFEMDLYRSFLDEGKHLTSLESSLLRGDLDTSHRDAHSIKGSAGNAGAELLSHLALIVERAVHDGNIQRALEDMKTLQNEFVRVRAFLREEYAIPR
jgi:two-component system sensor histidine kinase/response regulator